MATPLEQHIIQSNKAYAETYSINGLEMPPAKKATIVTCMDGRVDPLPALGLKRGDANIMRNAGAYSRDAVRSILLSNHVLGTDQVFIVKHTHCGMLVASTELAHSVMKKNLGLAESKEVDEFEVLPMTDLQKSAEKDVMYLRNHPLALGKVRVTGWILDIDTGLIKKVVD